MTSSISANDSRNERRKSRCIVGERSGTQGKHIGQDYVGLALGLRSARLLIVKLAAHKSRSASPFLMTKLAAVCLLRLHITIYYIIV